ncbi:MAG TPA: divalent-cation tolerance protein CutA [Aeromonadales bacterium]|nr:divalent-cation tolerance protein CutA [Aeromonadales bacterium]
MQVNPEPTTSTHALVIMCTYPLQGERDKFIKGMLDNKLAACINVLPAISSSYQWQGNIEQCDESLLLIKTEQHLFQLLESFIIKHHPYEVPEILALPITQGSQSYLNWLNASLNTKN